MNLDHEAIRKAYPQVTFIKDTGSVIKDANENDVAVEQSKIDAARTELNTEAAKIKYQTDRTTYGSVVYEDWREQLAMLYDDIVAGKLDATGSFAAHNKAVKDANPKP